MLHSSRAKKAAEQYGPQATITSGPPEDISVPVSNFTEEKSLRC